MGAERAPTRQVVTIVAVHGHGPLAPRAASWAFMTSARLAVVALVLLAPIPLRADVGDGPPQLVRSMAAILGFDEAALARLAAGDIISTDLSESSSKELALAVAMIVPAGHRQVYSRIRNGQWFAVDRTVLAVGELSAGTLDGEAFGSLELEEAELERLADARPGVTLNLSSSEIDRIKASVSAGARDKGAAALATYRDILAARVNAYRGRGIDGIDTYARGGGSEASTAADARRAAHALAGMDALCAEFYRAFTNFPERGSPAVEHRFFWAAQRIQGRPTVVLSHWAMQLHDDYGLVAERQYYVGQAYNTLQIVTGAFRMDDRRSVVFYTNRTATEQVLGFGSVFARAIGRKVMREAIIELFRRLRRSLADDGRPSE